MKKRVIFLTVLSSMVMGTLAATAVSVTMSHNSDSTTSESTTKKVGDTYFALNNQPSSLPDLTTAAQMGVDAVVNVDVTKKIKVQRNSFGGGQIDPFELFFGPSSQRNNDQAPQYEEQERKGGGSGVIIAADGYIVTNNHVIDGADEIKVTLNAGDSYTAKLIGADPSTDIALLKIEASELPFLQFGNSDNLRLGEWVLAIGNPYGLNSTVTAGIVSAKGRALGVLPNSIMGIESFIQTDAAVNPGNSGGALVTTDGSLVGINTLIKSPTGTYTGYSFAVPSEIARKVVGDIRQYGIVQRAMLGIAMQEITPEWIEKMGKETGITQREGVYVPQVNENSAADMAGIKQGDVIMEINDTKITSPVAVQEIIARYRPGDKVKVTVKRKGEVKHFDVTLRNKKGNEQLMTRSDVDIVKELGAELLPINDRAKKELKIKGGLQVIEISSNGLLARSKVKRGFIITAINERPVNSIDDINRIDEELSSIDGVYPNGQIVSYQIVK